MKSFRFAKAEDEASALRAGAPAHAMFLAGGTNLVDLMKLRVQTPEALVDVTALPYRNIEARPDGSLWIGALVKNSDLAHHPEVARRYPVLAEALLSGASPQLRNMASVGGNLLQRTRCTYFNDVVFPCNKRQPGSGCPAIAGFNRGLAVLGTSDHCIASNPSDMNVALAALAPIIHVKGPRGERTIAFGEFHLLPGVTPERETSLKHGELITAVEVPALAYGRRSRYVKVRDRASYEFALTSAAVILDTDGNRIRDARVALGGVGAKPWRSVEAEKALVGAPITEATFTAAAIAALQGARPQSQNAFKIDLARRTLVRALQEAMEIRL